MFVFIATRKFVKALVFYVFLHKCDQKCFHIFDSVVKPL